MARRPAARPVPGRRPRRAGPAAPLAGFRVVEMAHHLSAPLAAMYLADFGADVVKVESLEGEDWRRWGRPSPAGMSQLFLAINRNKRSLSLDLGTAAGRRVLERLLGGADVLVTNWAPQVLAGLGLDPRRLARRHPRLIVAALSGFGARGPQADRRAFDIVVCGETGLLLPHPDGVSPPLVNAAPMTDTGGALMVALGVALALLHRERGGRAQGVEAALASVGIALQAHRFIWLEHEAAPELTVPRMAVYGAYATADGTTGLTAVAEGRLQIGLIVPDTLSLRGIFVAQTDAYSRDYYYPASGYLPSAYYQYNTRSQLNVTGTIVSYLRGGVCYSSGGTCSSGFLARNNSYDRVLAFSPPPFTPAISTDYSLVLWREQ